MKLCRKLNHLKYQKTEAQCKETQCLVRYQYNSHMQVNGHVPTAVLSP